MEVWLVTLLQKGIEECVRVCVPKSAYVCVSDDFELFRNVQFKFSLCVNV